MNNWYKLDIDTLYKKLNSSENGLLTKEANERLLQYGKNTLPSAKKVSTFAIFLNEFKNPIILLLIVAVIASFIGHEVMDGIAIIIIILIDVIMGTYQENKANNTASALRKLITDKTKVLRNKQIINI